MARPLMLANVLSMLVASGNGQRCNDIRAKLRQELLVIDLETGLSKIKIHREMKQELPAVHDRISREVGRIVMNAVADVPPKYFGSAGPAGRARFDSKIVN